MAELLRKKYSFLVMLCSMVLALGATSCSSDNPWNAPPGTPDFYDSRLSGYWQLVQINGYPISGTDTNYLYFNGAGRGLYYYFYDGDRYTEQTDYWCQRAVSGNTNYQVNIRYLGSGTLSTMNYWFDNGGNVFYLQWYDQGRRQTYTYSRYPSSPW